MSEIQTGEVQKSETHVSDLQSVPSPLIIPVKDLFVDEDRARKKYEDIHGLAESILKNGLIHPLVVTFDKEHTRYVLVAGGRRYRACLTAMALEATNETKTPPTHPAYKIVSGYLPCTLFSDLDKLSQKEIELEENIQRKDLSWPEQLENLNQINKLKELKYGKNIKNTPTDPEKWDVEKLEKLIGRSPHYDLAFARKLEKRPDIKEKITHLPKSVAKREFEKILDTERVERLHAAGQLKISNDLKFGSCLDLIPAIPSESIDCITTDPPFGIPELNDDSDRGVVQSYTSILKPSDNMTLESSLTLLSKLVPELFRVLKPGGHVYIFHSCDQYPKLVELLTSSGFTVDPTPIIWNKGRSTSPFRGYNYMPCYEPILFAWKGEPRKLISPVKNIIEVPALHASKKLHPFEKPIELLNTLITNSTNRGDSVLDPFAASGSTLVAALNAGRCAIGFEIDQDHYFRAQKRLSELKVG